MSENNATEGPSQQISQILVGNTCRERETQVPV